MLLIYPGDDEPHSPLRILSQSIHNSTGIFRYTEDEILHILVEDDEGLGWAWLDVESAYKKGKAPKPESRILSLARPDE